MSDLSYEITRSLRDVQSRMSSLDHRLSRALAPSDPGPTGERFYKKAVAFLLRSKSDHARADAVERAVTNPAATTVAGWAAELTNTTVGGLLLSLGKVSAYAAVASRTPPFAIGPELQKVTIGGEIIASFIAEGSAIGVSQGALSSQTLTPKKVASVAVITDELERSAANIESTLRRLMSAGLASALDSVFFGSTAVSSAAPAGILSGISATTASAVTPQSEAMRLDLQALVGALTSPSDPCFIVSPSRLVYLTATLPSGFAYPMFASGALPVGRIVCIDAGALVAAHAAEPRFSISIDATLHMNDAPLPLSATGSPNTVAAPTLSTYQADLLALRTILWVTWALRSGGVSYMDSVTW